MGDVAQRLLAQKKQMEGKMEKKVQQVMEEAEHQREEALQIQLAQVNQEVGEAARQRAEELEALNTKVTALQQVMLDDAEYKKRSHEAHKVSQAVLAINKCLESNSPFASELSTIKQ